MPNVSFGIFFVFLPYETDIINIRNFNRIHFLR